MLTTLTTSYTDTRAGDLAWCLGGRELPALAELDLHFDRIHLQLRLLGASHQVMLGSPGPGEESRAERRWSETVACLPGRRTPLPARVAEHCGDWEYEFAARIESLPPHTFAARAQELLALVENHPHGLAGVFPGDPSAFTALLAGGRGRQVYWRTWHAYPQEGRLVCTRSSLVRPASGIGNPLDKSTAVQGS
ncbi:DUF2617 family protein [Phaeacidiphilus oryzae]|jgi:hypothetical protein|uniref:DUF2617 family protein n=1 Tax=Phaeacidiphilus oryzae TaxID=348818 RepID=UPI000566166D|nr:DUF2617 family protein [Phaeacidiphilus oryzae]